MTGVPDWVSDITIAQILLFFVGVSGVIGLWRVVVKPFLPFVNSWRNFLEDWNGESSRAGVPGRKGVMETLAEHGALLAQHGVTLEVNSRSLEKVRDQVTPNHGSTMKLSEEVQALRDEVIKNQELLGDHMDAVPIKLAMVLKQTQQMIDEHDDQRQTPPATTPKEG